MSKVMKIEQKSEQVLDIVTKPVDASNVLETVETSEGKIELQQKTDEQLVSERDPAAAAGALFALYGTRLYAIVNALSAKQLRRLIKALVVYPLEDQFVNKKNELEMNAYHMATKMIESRFLLTLSAAWEEEEKRKQFVEEQKTKDAKEIIPEAVTNIEGEKNV